MILKWPERPIKTQAASHGAANVDNLKGSRCQWEISQVMEENDVVDD